jgi:hypothetical protein
MTIIETPEPATWAILVFGSIALFVAQALKYCGTVHKRKYSHCSEITFTVSQA